MNKVELNTVTIEQLNLAEMFFIETAANNIEVVLRAAFWVGEEVKGNANTLAKKLGITELAKQAMNVVADDGWLHLTFKHSEELEAEMQKGGNELENLL